VGDVIRFLRQPVVQLIATRIIPVLLVGWLLMSIWRPSRSGSESRKRADDAEDTSNVTDDQRA
jgi:hypothetical protein